MIVDNEPFLIEYNVRMGDPECQTILPMLRSELLDILLACIDEKLEEIQIKWKNLQSLCVVLCSKGYPDEYKKNIRISNFDKLNLDDNNYLFHAGTKKENDEILAIGGRVLNFISLSNNLISARKSVIENLNKLDWDKGFFRKDIAFKVIDT